MKYILTLFTVFVTSIGITQNMAGEYEVIYDTANSFISYNLNLNPDGSFDFHYYKKDICDICEEKNQYGKGTWKSEKKRLFLSTNPNTDLDDKHTLNLSNSKAHFISKSLRDKSDKVVKTRLKFYESDIPWIKGMEVIKK